MILSTSDTRVAARMRLGAIQARKKAMSGVESLFAARNNDISVFAWHSRSRRLRLGQRSQDYNIGETETLPKTLIDSIAALIYKGYQIRTADRRFTMHHDTRFLSRSEHVCPAAQVGRYRSLWV